MDVKTGRQKQNGRNKYKQAGRQADTTEVENQSYWPFMFYFNFKPVDHTD